MKTKWKYEVNKVKDERRSHEEPRMRVRSKTKRKHGRRTTIEWRAKDQGFVEARDWTDYRHYHSLDAAEQALDTLNRNDKYFEYRLKRNY